MVHEDKLFGYPIVMVDGRPPIGDIVMIPIRRRAMPKWLDEIRARAEAATEGPWQWDEGANSIAEQLELTEDDEYAGEKFIDAELRSSSGVEIIPTRVDHHELMYDGDWISDADRAFIAHARTDIPRLLRHVARLRVALAWVVLHARRNQECTDCKAAHGAHVAINDEEPPAP